MTRPCPNRITCPPDQPGTNYSSEGVDLLDYPGIFYIENPPPLGRDWTSNGCIGLCTSTVSQEDADLCALQQAELCINEKTNTESFENVEQSCFSQCPDGSLFTFVVPAGRFTGASQAEADAAAFAYACAQANLQRLCLGNLSPCLCNGVHFSARLTVEGATRSLAFSIAAGALPDGLTMDGSVRSDMQTVIEGTPTTAGSYTFTIHTTDANGSYASKIYTLHVIEISDTSLPDFELGVPYSHQLTATGGSGNYAFKITTGSLPPGLTMSISGLISGTPTGGASGTLTFEVVDTECEETDKTFFPPRIAMTTTATTRIATLLGYSEFPGYASSPPKKYRKLTWEGASEQWATVLSTGQETGRARYVWADSGEIDLQGHQLTNYTKNFYSACPDKDQWPLFMANANSGIFVGINLLKGYCWTPDPNSCSACESPTKLVEDVAIDSISDYADFLRGNEPTLADSTHFQVHLEGQKPASWKGTYASGTRYSTDDGVSRFGLYYQALGNNGPVQPGTGSEWTLIGPGNNFSTWNAASIYSAGTAVSYGGNDYTASIETGPMEPENFPAKWKLIAGTEFPGTINPVVNFPDSTLNGVNHWVMVKASHHYEALLEEEYTDGDALNNAYVYHSAGNTAENTPRTTGFVSRFTSVAYRLVCSNLIALQNYTARVRFYNTKTGASTFQSYSFTPSGDTHIINGTVPTPAAGAPLQVKDPTIAFA